MRIASPSLPQRALHFSDGVGRVYRSGPPAEPRRAVFALLKTRNQLFHKAPCTKSLRYSFGLTTLVRLEGIPWCAALGRTRHTVRLAPLPWSLDGRTLFLSEERTNT